MRRLMMTESRDYNRTQENRIRSMDNTVGYERFFLPITSHGHRARKRKTEQKEGLLLQVADVGGNIFSANDGRYVLQMEEQVLFRLHRKRFVLAFHAYPSPHRHRQHCHLVQDKSPRNRNNQQFPI